MSEFKLINMKLKDCKTEADFFGWYYKECKKSNYDLHWNSVTQVGSVYSMYSKKTVKKGATVLI